MRLNPLLIFPILLVVYAIGWWYGGVLPPWQLSAATFLLAALEILLLNSFVQRKWGVVLWAAMVIFPVAVMAPLLMSTLSFAGTRSASGFSDAGSGGAEFYLLMAIALLAQGLGPSLLTIWLGALLCWPRRVAWKW